MIEKIDARGLSCPQPVILTKKALEGHNEIIVTVDNENARENVRRMAQSLGCEVKIEPGQGEFHIHIIRGCSFEATETGPDTDSKRPVVVISSDTMGRGNEELGGVLMKSFIHTLIETSPRPDTMIFLNTGVKQTVTGSDVIEDLQMLSDSGVKILVCGTCLNFLEIKDSLCVGIVSNMYDIAGTMLRAKHLVQV